MEMIINNWYIIVATVCLSSWVAIIVRDFYFLPSDSQIEKAREWLLYAVTMAEKELGNGTGKLKLRWCYDKFISKFPFLVKAVPFAMFSDWVDDALEEMKKMLATNDSVKHIVEGKN